jgi:hypothetical protein
MNAAVPQLARSSLKGSIHLPQEASAIASNCLELYFQVIDQRFVTPPQCVCEIPFQLEGGMRGEGFGVVITSRGQSPGEMLSPLPCEIKLKR